jgi:aldehyde:ferredoxin oxidoreductase
MECFEQGLLGPDDVDGLELRFGNGEALLTAIELIAFRRRIGGLLAEGAFRASQQLGRGSEKFAIHVKGVESGYHEPRLKPGFGLGLMVNPHGADHCCNMQDPAFVEESQMEDIRFLGLNEPVPAGEIGPYKVAILKAMIEKSILFDSLGLCQMIPYSFEQVTELTRNVTGWNTSISELLRAAERILTTARMFNLREGFTVEDDRLPVRFFQPKADGSSVGPLDPKRMERIKRHYYLSMGWAPETGVPSAERAEELGIV